MNEKLLTEETTFSRNVGKPPKNDWVKRNPENKKRTKGITINISLARGFRNKCVRSHAACDDSSYVHTVVCASRAEPVHFPSKTRTKNSVVGFSFIGPSDRFCVYASCESTPHTYIKISHTQYNKLHTQICFTAINIRTHSVR